MRSLKSIAIGTSLIFSTLAISTMAFPMLAHAQSSIEKAFIAKSKLENAIWKKHDPSSSIEINHSDWDDFLEKYVAKDARGINRLAYGKVSSADKKLLSNYLNSLQQTDTTKLNRNEQYAFWVNLYNASVVNVALKNYPLKSILKVKSNPLDLKGPFNDVVAKVNGRALTPDTIESGIVRPIWNDPNLHYAFNCAAVSCPNLNASAFKGSTINSQLEAAAKSFINDPRAVTLKNGKLTASKIYFWYSEDFGGEKGVLKHIIKYANPATKQKLAGKTKIDAYEYDWTLNAR